MNDKAMTARALLEVIADRLASYKGWEPFQVMQAAGEEIRAIASSLEGQAVRCDAIPKHDWQELSCEPGLYEPSTESGYKHCKRCGTRVHFIRERTDQSKDKPA